MVNFGVWKITSTLARVSISVTGSKYTKYAGVEGLSSGGVRLVNGKGL